MATRDTHWGWDAAAWLRAWDEASQAQTTGEGSVSSMGPTTDTSTRRRALLSRVMSSTRERCTMLLGGDGCGRGTSAPTAGCITTTRSVAVVVNALHVVQFKKTASTPRGKDGPPEGAVRNRGTTMHYAAELPLTPTASGEPTWPLAAQAARPNIHIANSNHPGGERQAHRRRIVFAFRDASHACGPDALHVLPAAAAVDTLPSSCGEVHTSARILLQTDVCYRLRWWRDAAGPSGTSDSKLESDDGNHFDVYPVDGKSKSGVMEAWYVPAVSWVRHGIERGFDFLTPLPHAAAPRSPTACTDDVDKAERTTTVVEGDDVLVVAFDARVPSFQQSLCQQRLSAVMEAAVALASPLQQAAAHRAHDDDCDDAITTRLLVDVGSLEVTGTRWRQFQDAALGAAKDVARLLHRSCRVECEPAQLPSPPPPVLSAPPPRRNETVDHPPKVAPSPRSLLSVLPIEPFKEGTAAAASPTTAATTNRLLAEGKTEHNTSIENKKRSETMTASGDGSRDDDSEDVPLWKRYVVASADHKTPTASTSPPKQAKVAAPPVSTTTNMTSLGARANKRLLLSGGRGTSPKTATATTTAVDGTSSGGMSTTAAASTEHRPSASDDGGGPLSGSSAGVLFVEVPADAASIRHVTTSPALRRAIVDWYRPMMAGAVASGWHNAANTTESILQRVAAQPADPSPPPPPLRVVVFMCHSAASVSQLLLSWCDVAHDDCAKIPYLIAVSKANQPGDSGDGVGGGGGDTSSSCFVSTQPNDDNEEAEGAAAATGTGALPPSTAAPTTIMSVDTCDALFDYVGARLQIDWGASLVLRTSPVMEQCCHRRPMPSSLQHLPNVEWKHDVTHHAAQTLPRGFRSRTDEMADNEQHFDATTLERLRRRVGRAACAVFGPFFEQLLLKPRRPEVAVEMDRRGGGVFLGIVRPPSSAVAVRSGAAKTNLSPHSVRLTTQQRATIVDAMRLVFSEEYRVAMDALQMHRRLEKKGRRTPYLSGFCPLFVSPRRVRIASVVRGNLFAQVELNLDDPEGRLLQLLSEHRQQQGAQGDQPEGEGAADGSAADARRNDATTPLLAPPPPPMGVVEAMTTLLLPMARCNCTPRIGERAPRVLPGSRTKLCRHLVQLVFHFLDVYTTTPGAMSAAVPATGDRGMLAQTTGTPTVTTTTTTKGCKQHQTTRLMLAGHNHATADAQSGGVVPTEVVEPPAKVHRVEHASVDFAAVLQWRDGGTTTAS